MPEVIIITSKEQSTLASTWTEHLCIHKSADGKWCIDIRGYEVAGEASEYEDDEGNLPDVIEGLSVVGTEDGYVVVDNLVLHSDDYPEYCFETFSLADFDELFAYDNSEWCSPEVKKEIQQTLTDLNIGFDKPI